MQLTTSAATRLAMEIGKVYHQQFTNGEKIHVRIVSQFNNGRFKALVAYGNRKPIFESVDPTLPFWKETPENEIPKKLKA